MRRGALVQSLLPFNADTSASDQGAVDEAQLGQAYVINWLFNWLETLFVR